MLEGLMKKYALSRQGAVDLLKATFSSMLADLILMLPVALLYRTETLSSVTVAWSLHQ